MGLFLLQIVLALQIAPPANAWCDVVFKDVVREADVVLIARAEARKGEPVEFAIVDVMKGEFAEPILDVHREVLSEYGIRTKDHVLLALGKDGQLVSKAPGLGACFPVSLVRLRGEKLRGKDRVDYDSRREPMTLDELRRDLAAQFR